MNKTILIIDDDNALRAMLARGLRALGFSILDADSAESADEILRRIIPDAIVLDRMMGGRDGLTALRAWRARGMNAPVIMLTAMTGPENTIDGLESGADDYLAKPFQLRELALRLENMMRTRPVAAKKMPTGITVTDGVYFINDVAVNLSAPERAMMDELMQNPGGIAAGAPMTAKRLREKLADARAPFDILTIRGRGYKIVTCNM
ncbi:MAG: response regulator transcription factor [Rickettsiales bacterium]|jgi:DNA-binding response OmpR family regulator|nr:response regulator transcription factor [Rickettsiales bacterium]